MNMQIYFVPFEDKVIVYRPLKPLAFVGNDALVAYIRGRLASECEPTPGGVEDFLGAVGFWDPDPPAPTVWQPEETHSPTAAVLLMTSACNLRCTYCYAFGGEGPLRQMTRPLAQEAIDVAHENALAKGEDRFSLTFHGGGEPTVNWDVLIAAVSHARSKELACEITMSTNGVLSETKREFVLQNFDGVSLSFVENTLCDGFQVEPTYSDGRGAHTDPDAELSNQFVRSFLDAYLVAAEYGRSIFYSGAKPWSVATEFCSAARDGLIVNPAGELVSCFEIHDDSHPLSDEFTVGRVTPSDGSVAGGVQFDLAALRGYADKDAADRKECEGCFAYWSCAGDCATRRQASVTANHGRCHVNREILKEMLAYYVADGEGVWRGDGPEETGTLSNIPAPSGSTVRP